LWILRMYQLQGKSAQLVCKPVRQAPTGWKSTGREADRIAGVSLRLLRPQDRPGNHLSRYAD
jgi:hypothetical protein